MKEEWYFSIEQIRFLEKVMNKIEGGWDKYSLSTMRGIQDSIRGGYYGSSQRIYLNSIREDYIRDFCK